MWHGGSTPKPYSWRLQVSLYTCSEFSVSLIMCICDGNVFALDQSEGYQGSSVPLTLQADTSVDVFSWDMARRGLHCICEQKSFWEQGCLGKILLLELS